MADEAQMMSIPAAIARLKNRDEYLEGLIAKRLDLGQSAYWQGLDREAIALAISALEYLAAMQAFEAAQAPR